MNQNITTDSGDSATIDWLGGKGQFAVDGGSFDGVTVKLQVSTDGGTTWRDVGSDVTLAVAGHGEFTYGTCKLRVNHASGSGAVNVNWYLTGRARWAA